MLQDECAIPRNFASLVVVRLNHSDASGIIDQIRFRVPNIKPHAHRVIPGHQRKAGNITHKHLWSHSFVSGPIGFKLTMRSKHALPKKIIEAQSDVEAVGWIRQIEVYFYLEPCSNLHSLKQRTIILGIEFHAFEQLADDRNTRSSA